MNDKFIEQLKANAKKPMTKPANYVNTMTKEEQAKQDKIKWKTTTAVAYWQADYDWIYERIKLEYKKYHKTDINWITMASGKIRNTLDEQKKVIDRFSFIFGLFVGLGIWFLIICIAKLLSN